MHSDIHSPAPLLLFRITWPGAWPRVSSNDTHRVLALLCPSIHVGKAGPGT